ncbi:MAG: hypothetical protein LBC59_09040 [Chitinispirillales bacterium]|jgi:hypothetical protein|nr:hypothetical protein [Chitinispirillales bacterium]
MTSFVKTLVKSTLALSVICAAAFAQPKPKAAVYIMGNPEGRDAIRSAVNTFLIKSGKYQMIAVDAIDFVAQEQKRQMSGSVSDGDIAALGRDAGAEYVCVVQRSELDGTSYVAMRMVSVQSKVAEFADMVELPRGTKVISVIERQINTMLGISSDEEQGGGYEQASELPSHRKPLLPTVSYLRINGQSETDVSFGSAGGMKTLTVSTDGSSYDITFVPAWCSVDKYGASFSLTCTPNQTTEYRNDWFNVTSGDKTVKVTVSQSNVSGSDRVSSAKSDFDVPLSARAHRIGVSADYSYGISFSREHAFDSIAPADLDLKHFSTLSLSMGLNLYKSINAYIDLGIKDKGVKNAIEWAGRVGSKYFELQIDYNFIAGEVLYWNDANIGVNKNSPPDLKANYDQTWMTVALMYSIPFYIRPNSAPFKAGLFYNHAEVPALVWVNYESEDKENRFAFLDKSCPVTTFGVRLNCTLNRSAIDGAEGLSRGWTVRLPFWFIFDWGYGYADPDKSVIAQATEKGGHYSKYSFPTFYMGGRLTLLAAFFNRFTENNIVHVGLGFGLNGVGYVKNEQNNGKDFNNWSSVTVAGWTPVVRVGYVW